MSVVFNPAPRRILVRSVNWLGDAVMTTPALLRLRQAFPEAHIALLCPEKLRELWRQHRALDETLTFAAAENVFSTAKRLRPGRFDLALVLPNSPRAALEVFLAGIPRRIGYQRPWRNFFLTQTVPPRRQAVTMRKRSNREILAVTAGTARITRPSPLCGKLPAVSVNTAEAHQTNEYLNLVSALGASPEPLPPRLEIAEPEIHDALEKFGIAAEPRLICGLNPGAEYGPAKRWPIEKFIAAAREIQRRTDCVWLLFGGKNDAAATAQIQLALGDRPAGVINLAGRTSLRELMALLKLCRVLLTNDTGPMHVAAALGTPVVVPFGSTSPELTGPGLPGEPQHHLLKSGVACSPCFLRECPIDFRCMNAITVELVVKSLLTALQCP